MAKTGAMKLATEANVLNVTLTELAIGKIEWAHSLRYKHPEELDRDRLDRALAHLTDARDMIELELQTIRHVLERFDLLYR